MARSSSAYRRRFQFRLQTLLAVMLVLCVGLAWFANTLQRAQRQRRAVAEIIQLGGWVKYDYEISPVGSGFARGAEPSEPKWLLRWLGRDFFHGVVYAAFCNRSELADDDLAWLEDLPRLTGLSIDRGQITDAGLAHVAKLSRLQNLTLAQIEITDAGLDELSDLKQLQSLNLFGTRINGSGLDCLHGVPHLRQLNLAYTQLADDELVRLRDCRQLEELKFRGTNITDVGLEYLDGLTGLKRIDLSATKVSDAAIEDLRAILPNTRITR